jgi:oligopeptide/dipeptide ABC transporter ATP-binding protein
LNQKPLLSVRNLSTYFFLYRGTMRVLDSVTFDIQEREIFGLVGESGSGKTVCAFSILRLIEEPGRIIQGQVLFRDRDILKLTETEVREIRGKKIAMIFQQAKTALNPFMRVGDQIERIYATHEKVAAEQARQRTIETLRRVEIPEPERRARDYPHQLSGGMSQRVMIALMTACNPELLIADEPTTGLDVTTQAQILDVMKEIRDKQSSSILLITHDLGIVAQTCDRVAVMHAGHIVESGSVYDIFKEPRHPYTRGLLESIPHVERKSELKGIPGVVPSLRDISPTCRFYERCSERMQICSRDRPTMIEVKPGHMVMCHACA